MPQRELIGPNAPQHATLPLSGQEVIHAVQNGESVVIFPEDIVPESAAPTAHAASHASNGADPITPASIGAATTGDLAAVSAVASGAATAASTAQTTANAALPKPGGTTTANGIVTGSGTAGAAVAVSTTTVGALVGSIAFADDKATDALSSYAQASHTGARTLATTDAGDTIPLTGAALFTIPHTLFGAAGTNRAFGCCIEVKTGGVPTFAGSGGIAIIYHGKSSGWAVGEMIWVEVTSATTAHVFTSLVTP